MRKYLLAFALILALAAFMAAPALAAGFEQGIVINVDSEDYYFNGPPVNYTDPTGPTDIPGHYWMKTGSHMLLGKHYNTGPSTADYPDGIPQWWSSDTPDGALLYLVIAKIDTWNEAKAARYTRGGFVHYHELAAVDDGEFHPTKVVWLKHIAVSSFTLDGGPATQFAHDVKPGIDFDFIPNGLIEYDP